MTLEITHERMAIGYNQNVCNMTSGENMPDFRESDLKHQHVSDQYKRQYGTIFKCALKS